MTGLRRFGKKVKKSPAKRANNYRKNMFFSQIQWYQRFMTQLKTFNCWRGFPCFFAYETSSNHELLENLQSCVVILNRSQLNIDLPSFEKRFVCPPKNLVLKMCYFSGFVCMIYLFERCTRPFVVLDMFMNSFRVGIVGAKIKGCKKYTYYLLYYYI